MAHLHEGLLVRWPAAQVPSYLEWYMDQLAVPNATPGTLELKLPGDVLGVPGGVSIGREVVATYAPAGDELDRQQQQLSLHWSPKHGGAFPTFKGSLTLHAEPGGRCFLSLTGDYEPPFGPAGQVFDMALGHRIAQETARELLRRIKDVMEESARS